MDANPHEIRILRVYLVLISLLACNWLMPDKIIWDPAVPKLRARYIKNFSVVSNFVLLKTVPAS